MSQQVYKALLEVMQSRRGPYAGLDIPEFFDLVKVLFTPEEAQMNNVLGKRPEPIEQIASKCQRDPQALEEILESMADKGLCATFVEGGQRLYQGLPFMPGIFEYQFISGGDSDRERDLARLIHGYKKAYDAAKGIAKITFPVTRVIPVDRTIDAANRIHTYDQVATYIQKYESIGVGACYCRHAAKLRGEDTHAMPMDVCMWFGKAADYMVERIGGKKVSKKGAMAILDRAEAAGLIHMSRNTTEEIEFLCNCDRWHCEVVTQVLNQDKPGRVFNSGYMPVFDSDHCVACATCIERCPAGALTLSDEQPPKVDLDRCFGCAVCATGCAEEAIAMAAKPDFPPPPKTVKELIAGLKRGHAETIS
jgi:Pyruvate/2-oxoacid:ferredoxin oxidoreductase delta subunit